MIEVKVLTRAGRYHLSRGEVCQDHGSFLKNESTTTIVLCDGAGSSEYGGVAAKILADTLPKHLQNNFERYLYGNPSQVKREIEKAIEQPLLSFAREHRISRKMLATTVMTATMENDTGRFVAFHLGDGKIIWKENKDESFGRMSSPRNGRDKSETWLTMNTRIFEQIKYIRWRDNSAKNILMMTDGMEGIARKKELPIDDYSYAWIYTK